MAQGTGFTNLQKYLDASRGAGLGQNVAGRIRGEADRATGRFEQSRGDFERQVGQGLGTEQDSEMRRNALNRVGGLTSRGQVVGPQDDVEDVIGQQDVDRFSRFRSGQYEGPTEVKDASRSLRDARDVQRTAQATRTGEGRFGLLRRYFGGPQYTLGQQRLDDLVLGSQSRDLKGARQAGEAAARQIGEGIEQTRGQAAEAGARAAKFGRETREMIGVDQAGNVVEGTGQIGDEFGRIQDRTEQLRNENQQIDGIVAKFQRGESLTPEEREMLTGQQEEITLYNVDPSGFYQQGLENIAPGQAATEDMRARLFALQQLGGVGGDLINYEADPYQGAGLNRDAFFDAVNQAEQNYQDQYGNLFYRGPGQDDTSAEELIQNLSGMPTMPTTPVGGGQQLDDAITSLEAEALRQESFGNAAGAATYRSRANQAKLWRDRLNEFYGLNRRL